MLDLASRERLDDGDEDEIGVVACNALDGLARLDALGGGIVEAEGRERLRHAPAEDERDDAEHGGDGDDPSRPPRERDATASSTLKS